MNLRPEALSHVRHRLDLASTGEEMFSLMAALFPICRSISGNGLRQSLGRLAAFLPLATHEVATGTRAFDWIVPKEWNIRDAYIKDSAGRRGLVPALGGKTAGVHQFALLWALNLSDHTNGILDIAERSGLPFDAIRRAVDALTACGVLDRVSAAGTNFQ